MLIVRTVNIEYTRSDRQIHLRFFLQGMMTKRDIARQDIFKC